MSVTEKTQIGTIDLTPTWEEILGTLLVLVESGSDKGRNMALAELQRMAKLADLYVVDQKESLAKAANNLAKISNENPMTKEQAEEITRRST